MNTEYGHLTYCSNIHPGQSWAEHFQSLQDNIPFIREQLAPGKPFALGLRVANEASLELSRPAVMDAFKTWLAAQNVYVFVINGFPYGGFHNTVVKDDVHTPDWTTRDRLQYTIRLFRILSELLPEGMHGGVSTPPLSYRLWWNTPAEREEAEGAAMSHIMELLDELISIEKEKGQLMHLDIEPEPDGLLDNIGEFITWYRKTLLPVATAYLTEKYGVSEDAARELIFKHIQLCYDICHAAVGYEDPETLIQELEETGIQVGRIQVSSALRVDFSSEKEIKRKAIETFNEPVYLHQVVAREHDGSTTHYPDLNEALEGWSEDQQEWRVHFHVPLFIQSYGVLDSTQGDIVKTLALQKQKPFSAYMEVETYTWGVLPEDIQKPIGESIVRELQWVEQILNHE
ncbi:metabolite traffic protein EboE [Dyadobacter sandarakinus]|uniref:Metabolite traffic protein EboE n=1 Tax=Dyadobacter sandarakinus TaxID=2747268 RepID=A0ABX7IC01_9BACT|nr:metabolite traffic protein EboE [Dyadobacter sandarakinus]QRR03632.1 metabolite traffic protein EboE [Dyadobacter sandarakinus]